MKALILSMALCLATPVLSAQEYQFSTVADIETTPVISQGRTGTCWSFSTSSFLESEILRITGKEIDLSEMYNVRHTYPVKAENYVMRQGKAQFSEGGLAHDVINSVARHGLVPQSVYTGLDSIEKAHDHTEMVQVLTAMLDTYIQQPSGRLSGEWEKAIAAVLDVYLGAPVKEFTYEGTRYTPLSFLEMTGLNPDAYVSLTSFANRDHYEEFILNIPDNFSNGSFHNLPLDELVEVLDHALENGYSVELDVDVSESGFSGKHGLAVLPEDPSNAPKAFEQIIPELDVTPQLRLEQFQSYSTTDDHLMHITGIVKDQKGNRYYKVKNSWGTEGQGNGGFVYMSVPYLKMKAISILLHKEAIPDDIAESLSL